MMAATAASAESGQAPPGFDLDALPRFGDGERAAEIVAEIGHGGRLGMLVGQGIVAVGRR